MPDLLDLKDDHPKPARRDCPASRPRRPDYADMRAPSGSPASGRMSIAPPTSGASDLMRRIRAAADTGDPDDAIELIYSEVDALLRAGSFSQVDEILAAVEPSAWSVVHLLAFVSITSAARAHVGWSGLFDRVRRHLGRVDPTRVRELLSGFE